MSLKLGAEVKAREKSHQRTGGNRTMGNRTMNSSKKKIYRTVDQSLPVFKRQENEKNPLRERKKITADERSQERIVS